MKKLYVLKKDGMYYNFGNTYSDINCAEVYDHVPVWQMENNPHFKGAELIEIEYREKGKCQNVK